MKRQQRYTMSFHCRDMTNTMHLPGHLPVTAIFLHLEKMHIADIAKLRLTSDNVVILDAPAKDVRMQSRYLDATVKRGWVSLLMGRNVLPAGRFNMLQVDCSHSERNIGKMLSIYVETDDSTETVRKSGLILPEHGKLISGMY